MVALFSRKVALFSLTNTGTLESCPCTTAAIRVLLVIAERRASADLQAKQAQESRPGPRAKGANARWGLGARWVKVRNSPPCASFGHCTW